MATETLLDTNIVVRYLRKKPSLVTSKMAVIDQLYISETVLGELYYGAYHGDQTSRELGKIQEFLRGAAILYHDSATTRLVRVAPTNGMALVKSSRIPFEDSEASL